MSRRQSSRDQAAQRRVVEQEDAHQHAEQIEEVVVTRQQDQRLEQQYAPRREGPRTPGQEDQKYTPELDRESRCCAAIAAACSRAA